MSTEAAAQTPEFFDLIVIGAGPAGTCGANTVAFFGHKVALIEKEPELGGAGINSGTVPSKTLRETALALSGWRSRKLFGVDLSLRRQATIADFMGHSDRVSDEERHHIESQLDRNGVHRFMGTASFQDPHTVRIISRNGGEQLLRGKYILIATGSTPWRPEEFPFPDDRVHDSDELLKLQTMPKKLIVVGSGVIGSEYACTFAAMGVETHLVDGRTELLPFLDDEISTALEAAMKANGITFHWGERVVTCDVSQPGDVILHFASGGTLAGDGVLVCAGRASKTEELNLAAAGITPGKRGIIPVNSHYVSEVPHIYAAGDVVGPPALAATSMEQARAAMCHAFDLRSQTEISTLIPTGIYTIPEVSTVGETEASLQAKGIPYIAGRARYCDLPRGRIVGEESGFLKLLFEKHTMKLLGVHVMGEHATELLHIGLIAMMVNSDAEIFNRACFNYPTLGELYKYATYNALVQSPGNFTAPLPARP